MCTDDDAPVIQWASEAPPEPVPFDPVQWPHTSTALHLMEMVSVAKRAHQRTLAYAYGSALDRLECQLMAKLGCCLPAGGV